MYEGRRRAPWLPALIAGGIGAALISKRARWHHGQHGHGRGFGAGFGPTAERPLPPRIEEMLNAWHRRAHEEAPPSPEQPSAQPGPTNI